MNSPRRCKIIATLGPASNPHHLLEAGATAFRLNFSHGTHVEHLQHIKAIRKAAERLNLHVPLIADLQGPKIRIGGFEEESVKLKYNNILTIESSDKDGKDGTITLPHPEVVAALQRQDIIKFDDGALAVTVTEKISDSEVRVRVDVPGLLSGRKGVNLPFRTLPIPALTAKDCEDLAFALEQGIDVIALSFVQNPQDIIEAKERIKGRARILAKIEKPLALDQIEEIAVLSDMIMVARGDLGVELAAEQVPIAQRKIVQTCRRLGRPVVVATQMLQSMVDTPVPTRAEASDVATAVYMGADAVMLSAESAVGKHPATAVAMMDRLIRAVEADESFWDGMQPGSRKNGSTSTEALSAAARDIACQLNAKAIFAFSRNGGTALAAARERSQCPLYALTPELATARMLALVWGITPVISPDLSSSDAMLSWAEEWGKEALKLASGDRVAVLAGIPFGVTGSTNMLRIITC